MEGNKIDYSRLVYKSSDKKYFDLTLSSFYLKLINGNIDINVVKLNMKEFKKKRDKQARKKENKESVVVVQRKNKKNKKKKIKIKKMS